MNTTNRTLAALLIAVAACAGAPLVSVAKSGRPPPPPPTNTEPFARYSHGFTGNGGTAPATSRLYVFGGNGGYELDYQTLSDHWYFSVADASWIPAPTNSTPPSPRILMGFSCGGGLCVVANGIRGASWVKETWIYTEASGMWSQMNCKRYPCPSFRAVPAMAYDSARGYHVLFGGESDATNLGDTYTFSNATQRWTLRQPSVSPTARMWAAAAFVAGPVNRVVLFGGQENIDEQVVLCDMWSWTGTKWEEVTQINANDGPCLEAHSMAWDGARLVMTGGYVDIFNTPNVSVWTFEFTPDGKAGTWSEEDWYVYFQCTGAGVLRPGAFMAYDPPSGAMAFFGGQQDVETLEGWAAVAYDDLSVCY